MKTVIDDKAKAVAQVMTLMGQMRRGLGEAITAAGVCDIQVALIKYADSHKMFHQAMETWTDSQLSEYNPEVEEAMGKGGIEQFRDSGKTMDDGRAEIVRTLTSKCGCRKHQPTPWEVQSL